MRVLFLTQWFEPEPGATRGLPLAKSLRQSGDDVEVITGFPNYPGGKVYAGYKVRPWQRQSMDGVPVLRVALYPSHDGSAAGRILNYGTFALSAATLGTCLSSRADVAYIYHPPPTVGLPAIALKTFRRLPCVYHIADMWPESVIESGMIKGDFARRVANRVLSTWCNFVYRQSAEITVLSPGFKRLLIERGVPADKVHIVYNWTDEEVFHPVERDARLASEYGLADTFNIVYAGNVGAFQGVDVIVKAAAQVRDIPNLRVVIAGSGQKEMEVRALAREMDARNVVFLGRREYWEMGAIYGLADVLIVHLKDKPFFAATIPSKTQVSLACGRPVLMGVRGDSADIIENANAGLVCDPENPAAMADAMRRFFAMSRERLGELGANGRNFYLKEMSLAHGTQRMRDIFAKAALRGRRSRTASV
jgi:colanic acid biosynthesis glycosyl transferase WcaI